MSLVHQLETALREARRAETELSRFQNLAVELGAFVEVKKDKDRTVLQLKIEIDAGLLAAARDPIMVLQAVVENDVFPKFMAEVKK